jgi:2-polyprenyl-6-methoxyphenol hydroxylase-like FAD-dependent oxidoreductase
VDEILIEDGRAVGIKGRSKHGSLITERAEIVVGADGRHSFVAEAVRPEHYDEKPILLVAYYTYWSGLPMFGKFEQYIRDGTGFAAAPTHDGLTMVIAAWPYARFDDCKKDIEGNYLTTIALAPAFADRLREAKREARFAGAAVPNYFRKLCAVALDRAFSGAQPFDAAMRDYHRARDSRVAAMYEFTCMLATLEPPPPDMQRLLGAIHGNQSAKDAFARMNAGTISPAEFFAPENVNAITAA